MIKIKVNHGDYVVVRQQHVAEPNAVVVAMINDEATVKRLIIQDEHIELRPENDRLRTITVNPDDQFSIIGKVVAVRSLAANEEIGL